MFEEDKPKPSRNQRKTDLKVANLAKNAPSEILNTNPDKLSEIAIQHGLFDWITGQKYLAGEKPFGEEFRTYTLDPTHDTNVLIKVTDGKASYVGNAAFINKVWQSMRAFKSHNYQYKVKRSSLTEIVTLFKEVEHSLHLKTAPSIFCWESEKDKIAFNRVKDPAEIGFFWPSDEFRVLAPLYSDFLDRCSNPYEVRQYLGSILYPESDRKITLCLWGPTDAGKTTFISSLLDNILGTSGFATMETDNSSPRFLKHKMINKLAVLGDEAHPDFFTKPLFKQLTGGSKQTVDRKNKDEIDAELVCKFIFCANEMPQIPRDESYSSRILLSHISSITGSQLQVHEVKAQLLKELTFTLADLKQAYADLGGKKIKIPEDNHTAAIERAEEGAQLIFDELFEYFPTNDPKHGCFLTMEKFGKALKPRLAYSDVTLTEFYKFLRRKYKCVLNQQKSVRGKNDRYATYLKLKSTH